MFCNTVVIGLRGALECDQDGDRLDINDIKEASKIARHADVGATVNRLVRGGRVTVDRDGLFTVCVNTADMWRTDDVCYTISD